MRERRVVAKAKRLPNRANLLSVVTSLAGETVAVAVSNLHEVICHGHGEMASSLRTKPKRLKWKRIFPVSATSCRGNETRLEADSMRHIHQIWFAKLTNRPA